MRSATAKGVAVYDRRTFVYERAARTGWLLVPVWVAATFFWTMLPAGMLVLGTAFSPALPHRRDLRAQAHNPVAVGA
jgi:hypothetical protein